MIYFKSVLFGLVSALVAATLCVLADVVFLPGVSVKTPPTITKTAEPSSADVAPASSPDMSVTTSETVTDIETRISFWPSWAALVGFALGFYWVFRRLRRQLTR
jgi:hypothetical protein